MHNNCRCLKWEESEDNPCAGQFCESVGTADTSKEYPVNYHMRVTTALDCQYLDIHTIMLNGLNFGQTYTHNIRRASSGPKSIKKNIQCAKSHSLAVVLCHEMRHEITITPHN